MSQGQKPTFSQLLERHDIAFLEFFENCLSVPIEDISALYYYDDSTVTSLERMLEYLNKKAGTNYTPADIFIRNLYG